MQQVNIMTMQDLLDSRDGIPELSYKTRSGKSSTGMNFAKLDEFQMNQEIKEAEKLTGYDYEY